MGIKDKLPLLRSEKRITRIFGYVVYAFLILLIIGILSPSETPDAPPATPTTPAPEAPTPAATETATQAPEAPTPEPTPEPTETIAKELVSTSFSDFGDVHCDLDATDLQKQSLFDDKFKAKYVKWSGTVSSVSETWGSYTLQVKHCPHTWISDVTITMRDDQKDALLQLREGDAITYIAKLTRYGTILGISATDGEIVLD